MKVTLPLEKMTTEDKIGVMETLWEDLCRHPENVPSPSWHGQELRARDQRVQQGVERFIDWEQSKKNLRKSLKQ